MRNTSAQYRLTSVAWLLGLTFLLTFTVLSNAQSPLESAIRIENIRWTAAHEKPRVLRSDVTSRRGYGRGRVVVRAHNAEDARQAAIRYVYIATARNSGVSLKEFDLLKDQLAEALAELKTLHAKIESMDRTAEGYNVTVELTQSTGDIEKDLRRAAYSNFRLVALMPEWIDGQRVDTPQVETAFVGALAKKQFRVYDWNFVSSRKPLATLVNATLGSQDQTTTQIGALCLANVIVAGRVKAQFSQNNEGIISYRATADLRVIKTDTGQILTAHEYSAKGFGRDRSQAAREALDALSGTVAKELPDELESHFEEYPVTVQIPLQKPEQADQVGAYLRGMPGVKTVGRTLTQKGAIFNITSKEKPAALAARILESPDYRLSFKSVQ